MKLNTTCDFLCHEGFKNVYFVGVRNFEGENHPGHTVLQNGTPTRLALFRVAQSEALLYKHMQHISVLFIEL